MFRRMVALVSLGGVAIALASCDNRFPSTNGTNDGSTTSAQEKPEVAIGDPLYSPAEIVKAPKVAATSTPQADPIVIPNAQLVVPYTENVPTKNNGTLWQICTELTPDTPEKDIFVHPVDPSKKYRRLREGDHVKAGQLVALLDDKVARAKYNAAKTDLESSEAKMHESKNVADKQAEVADVFSRPNIASKVEQMKAIAEAATARKYYAESIGEWQKAGKSLEIADVQLKEHELRATIGGIIKTIYRKPGESVKELEPVLQIQNLDTFRAEGMLPVQYLPILPNARGKQVFLEPSSQLAPLQELMGHWQAVTGVAVSKDARKPLVVTTSEDRTVRVWDRTTKQQKAYFQFETPIRAVACTGAKAKENLALFGGDDGIGRIIDLDAINTAEQGRKLKEGHRGRINSVAFSPDGLHCATADDKEIFIWKTDSGELAYKIHAEHRGPITSIQFTPQARLVSVARDRTIRIWELGDKAARIAKVGENNRPGIIYNRSGNVDVLGVSPDGSKVLFDQEQSLQVRGIDDQRTVAVMPSPSDSTQFTGFAIFSPQADLVIAAGTGDNPLGVWRQPHPGSTRAFQRVRLAVGNSKPTCAAFDPNGTFAVVGTQDNRVLIFARPEKTEVDRTYPATITYIDQAVESTDRKVRLWAELPNPGMPLLPGDNVDLVIPVQ